MRTWPVSRVHQIIHSNEDDLAQCVQCACVFASRMNFEWGSAFHITFAITCSTASAPDVFVQTRRNKRRINFCGSDQKKTSSFRLWRLSRCPQTRISSKNITWNVYLANDAATHEDDDAERFLFLRLNCNCYLRRRELAFTFSSALFSHCNKNQRFNWPKPICLDDILPLLVSHRPNRCRYVENQLATCAHTHTRTQYK